MSAELIEYQFKTDPFAHQLEEWRFSRELKARAIFWDQGVGKTKLIIDTACWLYLRGLIDTVIVVAPNGVHRNWIEDELPDHVPDEVMAQSRAFAYQAPRADTKWHQKAVRQVIAHRGLAWFAISYGGYATKRGKSALRNLLNGRRAALGALDESHNAKDMEAQRTKSLLNFSYWCEFRRILSGTPISLGPFDAYPQIKWLDATYWERAGFSTYTEYKQHFGIWRKGWNPNAMDWKTKKRTGAEYDQLVGYHRLDELQGLISPIASRVLKEDVLDLPPKLYAKRYFDMSPEQAKRYREMRDEFMVWLCSGGLEAEARDAAESFQLESVCGTCGGTHEVESDGFIYECPDCSPDPNRFEGEGHLVAAHLIMVRMIRLQQITSGYLPTEDEEEPVYVIPGSNRRLEALMDEIRANPTKTIIWARFRLDVDLIMAALAAEGIRAVRYDGAVGEEQRSESKALFQGRRTLLENGQVIGREEIPPEEQAQVFVGNPQAGATGLTLTAARRVIYYSNSFRLIDRLQSEDRAHRIGQNNAVLYTDIMGADTLDEKIVSSLRSKFNIARQITGDEIREWI